MSHTLCILRGERSFTPPRRTAASQRPGTNMTTSRQASKLLREPARHVPHCSNTSSEKKRLDTSCTYSHRAEVHKARDDSSSGCERIPEGVDVVRQRLRRYTLVLEYLHKHVGVVTPAQSTRGGIARSSSRQGANTGIGRLRLTFAVRL